jgi:mannitol-1-phosphate 5-dehydrogenase
MIPTENRFQVDEQEIIIFGAGKIGRSFIGQLFGTAGYKIVFVDIDRMLIDLINNRKCYKVVTKSEEEETIVVENVSAICANDFDAVSEVVSTAGILAVSVGKNAVEKVIPMIASGLQLRYKRFPGHPLDIIIAENMISGGDIIKEYLLKSLPPDFPFCEMTGLIETSIGKMVPIMSQTDLEEDPLKVFAEPYNTLILDKKGFKTPIPRIKGLAPKENIKAWVDRKAFIHNLGHATAAYYGHFRHNDAVYMYEVLDDSDVLDFTRGVMIQSADILICAYPDDYTRIELEDHIEDLLSRFRNRFLKDTLFRVGHDLGRKLSSDDRFMGAVKLGIHHGKPFDKILRAMSYGFFFKVTDEIGSCFEADIKLLDALSSDFENTLVEHLKFNRDSDSGIIGELKKYMNRINV